MGEIWKFQTVDNIVAPEKGSVVTGPFGSSIGRLYWKTKGIPVIRGNNIVFDGPKFIDDNFIFISEEYYQDKMKRYTSIAYDIIFTAAGTIGQVGIIPESTKYPFYIVSNKQMRLRVDKEMVDPKFAYFYFRTKKIRELIIANNTGSTIPLINLTVLKKLPFPIVPLEEQKAIASILSALDDKIELNLQMNKTLEEMAMALYKHWFVDFGPFQNGNFVESELGMIPEGWEVKRLEEICNLTIGRTPPRKEPQWFSQIEGVKWISIKDIGNSGMYISQTNEYLTEEALKKFNVPVIKPNTVILSFKLTVGRVAISSERMLSNEAIAHLNRKDESLPVEFLYSYLRLFDYNTLGSTSSIATAVNTQTLKAMKLILPPDKILSDYLIKVSDIFQQIKINQEENQNLITLRNTLLPKLISGEIRVKDAEQLLAAAL